MIERGIEDLHRESFEREAGPRNYLEVAAFAETFLHILQETGTLHNQSAIALSTAVSVLRSSFTSREVNISRMAAGRASR